MPSRLSDTPLPESRTTPRTGRRRRDRELIVETWDVANSYALARAQLEAEEVLKCPGHLRAPRVRRDARQRSTVDENSAGCGLVHPGEQLYQRALASAILSH